MDRDAYVRMAAREHHHWWFRGRRAVLSRFIDRASLPQDAAIVEAGCGTGGNLSFLATYGRVSAFEPSDLAREFAASKHPEIKVSDGSLPNELPFARASFDLVTAFDVLEHVEDDRGALDALVSLAKPGGHLLVTVPAHQALYGSHDRRLHHHRRYSPRGFRALLDACAAEVVHITPYNTILAPFALIPRMAERLLGIDAGDQERVPPAPVNELLARIFALEAGFAANRRLPAGLSLVALLRAPRAWHRG